MLGGRKIGAIATTRSALPFAEDYHKLLEELEELEAIRAYDVAKASGDEVLPLEQALAEIEKDRQ